MLAPLDDQLALDAAQQCRALRLEVQQHSKSFQHLQRHKRQLHDEEFYQLLRQQQELLEDQKKQLEEHQRLVLEKDQHLRQQQEQMLSDRRLAQRWEQLAEFRQGQLKLEEAQMRQLEERLQEGVDAFAEQHGSYAECLEHFAEERRRASELESRLRSCEMRHEDELRKLKDCIQPLRPGPSRCCLFAAAAPQRQPVLWGAVPLRAPLQDVCAQTDEDARLLALEEQLRDSGLREERLKLEVKGLERALEEKDGLKEALSEALRRLETPEYVLHAELKQAYADLRDMEAQLRVSEDRVATVSSSCEQRLGLMRDQSQQLLEQTRIQASQSLLELTAERQRTEALSEELQGSARRLDVAGGEVEEAEDLLRLSREEAEMDAVHSREALEAQQRLYEEHCSQIRQEERLKEQVTSYLKESWRRCELQPALDQAQALRKTMEEDQRYAEALQVENHAILLEVAEKQAQLSHCSTEVAFAKAEVEAWKRGAARMMKEEKAAEQEAIMEEQRFLDACPEEPYGEALQASYGALQSTVDTITPMAKALSDVQPDKE